MLQLRPTSGEIASQQSSQHEIDEFLRGVRNAPTTKSPRVLGITQVTLMKARNNGYPLDMHHPELEMRQAFKEEEEDALAGLGYRREYFVKRYPKALFRRNMDQRFKPQYDLATNIQVNHSFVEEKTARNEAEEKALRAVVPEKGQSPWMESIADIPAIDAAPAEDPKETIARLQGMVEGLQAEIGKPEKNKGGRPRKSESEE